MCDLDTQLRGYFDHVVQRVEADDVLAERVDSGAASLRRVRAPRRPSSRSSLVLVAAAAVFVVFAAVKPLDSPSVDVVTVAPTASPSTAVASTTVPDQPPADDVSAPISPTEAGVVSVPLELAPDRILGPSTTLDASRLVWTQVAVPDSLFGEGGYLSDIVALGQRLVLLGTAQCGDERVAAVWTSEDGYAWSQVPHDAVFHLKPTDSPQCPRGFQEVVVGGPGLVVEGRIAGPAPFHTLKAAVWTSPDGLSWSRISPDGENDPDNVRSNISKLYLGGPGLVALGAACELQPGSVGDCPPEDMDPVIWTSSDGLVWTRADPSGGDSAFGAESLPENFIATSSGFVGVRRVATGFEFWRSPDGVTWTEVPLEQSSPRTCPQWLGLELAATDNAYVARRTCNSTVAETYYETVWTSTDGASWSATQLESDMLIYDVIAVGDSFVAVGGVGDLSDEVAYTELQPAIWTSTDGRTWVQVDLDPDVIGHGRISQVTLGGPGLVAYGESPDGPTLWVATTGPAG